MYKKTTRKLFTFLLTIVLLGTLAVCDTGGGGGGGGGGGTSKPAGVSTGGSGGGGNSGGGSGDVVITLPSGSSLSRNINARAVYPDPEIVERLVYTIQLTSGSNEINRTARPGQTVTVNVSVGRWRVYVEALDGSSVYGIGESYVDVAAGQPNSVEITLSSPDAPINIINIDIIEDLDGLSLLTGEELEFYAECDAGSTSYDPDAYTSQTLTIINIGNNPTGALTITSSNLDITADPTTIPSISVGGNATFVVKSTKSLAAAPAAPYEAIITVSNANISVSFNVLFYVYP